MIKLMKKIIITISLILLVSLSLVIYFAKVKAKLQADTITPVKIEVQAEVKSEIKNRLENFDQNISFDDNANIKITTFDNDWPTDWQSDIIYAQNLDLMPIGLGKFFQGEIPDSDLILYLASDSTANSQKLMDYLKTSFVQNKPKSIKLTTVGDIMLSRDVDTKMDKTSRIYPFEQTLDLTKNADFTFGNLESPFREGNSLVQPMIFGAEKTSIQGLIAAGFDALNLANNHFGNQGQTGMMTTFDFLNQNKIDYFGAGKNSIESHKPLIKEINGLKIAFLGYADTSVTPDSYLASVQRAGTNAMDLNDLKTDLAKAKKQADLVIVSMHAGYEYTPYANDKQIEFAHTAIDNGADLVIGHHPHVVQGLEFYKGKFIDYSLGNFIFDQPWSTETEQGLVANFTLTLGKITGIELVPVHIYNACQPKIVTDQTEFESIFSRIFASSEKLR